MGNNCFGSKDNPPDHYHHDNPGLPLIPPSGTAHVPPPNVVAQPHNSPARIRKLFNAIDSNRNGEISMSELRAALQNETLQKELSWPPHRYQELFDLLDPTRTGNITEDKLQHFCKVRWLFSEIDVTGNNEISSWELETALRGNLHVQRELQVPQNMAASLFKQIDTDGNGVISIVEFYRYYTTSSMQEPLQIHKNWEEMAVMLLDRMDLDRSGGVSLAELASALSHRSLQLQLGWPAHKAADLFNFLDNDSSGVISLENLRTFCRIRWLFHRIDVNRSEFIDNYEFGMALHSVSLQQQLGVNIAQAQATWLSMDPGRTNAVSFEAFYRFFSPRKPPPPAPSAPSAPSPPQSAKPTKPGDAYEMIRKIGEGGFGTVYLIKRKSDGLQLIMKKPKLDSGVVMEEVRLEADLMKRLKHPNIVRFIDSYEEDGALIIITEFAEGGDLRKKMGRPPKGLPPSEVFRIMKDSLEAMKYIHSRRILHRDLKPDNILLTAGGAAKIADLGLATQLQPTAKVAQTQCGTPVYMAPELLHGKPYDHKADMFSMGCILYELCTGKLTFRNQADIVHGKLPNDIPAWCGSLVRALLEPNSRLRLSSDEALKQLMQLNPLAGPRTSFRPQRQHNNNHQAPIVFAGGNAPHFR